ncbi:MAG: hypothetical protein WCQ21_30680 [Verrucomicrobiota bacterium]
MKTKKSLPSSAKQMEVSRTRLPEGLIEMVEVDSEWGKRIGLTSDVFAAIGEVGTQLYKKGDCMYIQAIEVLRGKRRQGHFNKLLQEIWSLGFTIKVPNPYRNMFNILNKKGFEQTEEQSLTTLEPNVEVVMVKAPPCRQTVPS